MRKEYEMTKEQLKILMEACKPVLMIMLQCGTPSSPAENANRAWDALGEEMGFIGNTARPLPSNKPRFFTAEVKEN